MEWRPHRHRKRWALARPELKPRCGCSRCRGAPLSPRERGWGEGWAERPLRALPGGAPRLIAVAVREGSTLRAKGNVRGPKHGRGPEPGSGSRWDRVHAMPSAMPGRSKQATCSSSSPQSKEEPRAESRDGILCRVRSPCFARPSPQPLSPGERGSKRRSLTPRRSLGHARAMNDKARAGRGLRRDQASGGLRRALLFRGWCRPGHGPQARARGITTPLRPSNS